MSKKLRWEWTPPRNHPGQGRLNWWVEQAGLWLLLRAGITAAKRGDKITLNRISAAFDSAARHERAAER